MVCRVVSRDREQTEHRVVRTDADISALYKGMVDKFASTGFIVPSPPGGSGAAKLMARYNKIGTTDKAG